LREKLAFLSGGYRFSQGDEVDIAALNSQIFDCSFPSIYAKRNCS
jgi:hypothetical protein